MTDENKNVISLYQFAFRSSTIKAGFTKDIINDYIEDNDLSKDEIDELLDKFEMIETANNEYFRQIAIDEKEHSRLQDLINQAKRNRT